MLGASRMAAGRQRRTEAAGYAEAGQKALAAGRYAEARENFEKLAKLEPGIAEVHATLAAIYFKQREYELSVREVRTAQKLKPSLPRLDSLLGLSLSELGNSRRLCRNWKRDSSRPRTRSPAHVRPAIVARLYRPQTRSRCGAKQPWR